MTDRASKYFTSRVIQPFNPRHAIKSYVLVKISFVEWITPIKKHACRQGALIKSLLGTNQETHPNILMLC